ncbi:MAG: TOBE domain-containing protein, partial [Deltaproteobacteria bacterium]
IGVRPENILLQDADPNDLYLGWGTIQRQEDLGHEILAQLMTESGLLLTVRTDGKIRHQNSSGDKVPISVSLNNVHAFSAEAGNRLT